MKKFIALLLASVMVLGLFAMGVSAETTGAEDKIVIMAPPVTGNYLANLKTWADDFHALYPNLTVEIIETSWGDHNDKLSTMAQAGEAPDIAEISSNALGTFVEMGVAIDIAKYMEDGRLADYDESALKYLSLEGTTYGLPLYLTIQSIGANKTMMEELGIDVAKIQKEGWTYEEFLDVIKKGTKDGTYGFVFANLGVTASDMLYIFGSGAGLSNAFTPDLKYAFTSENMLTLLKAVEEMTKSGYMPNYGVEAGQRMVMCQTGNAMIFGKAMPLFENNINKNNKALEANDGTAVENSIPVKYAFLPVPTMEGVTETCFGSVDGLIALRNNNTNDEHLKNVCLFLDYLCSGERAAAVDQTLLLDPVCKSGREAYVSPEGLDEGNVKSAARAIGLVVAPPAGITSEQSANAKILMDEVIIPKFQALLAGETTAQEMFDTIVKEAQNVFGAENCVSGQL